ncbi:MAG: hypothetical protein ACXABY_11715 [Candidatus Thorarchaeota archaeon]|jgi:hypothetical protein
MKDSADHLKGLFSNDWSPSETELVAAVKVNVESSGFSGTLRLLDWCLRKSAVPRTVRRPVILKAFGLGDFIGYVGDFQDFPPDILNSNDYELTRTILYEFLLDRTRQQIRQGGPTLFFDTTKMIDSPASLIVSDILSARKREIECVTICKTADGQLDLGELWTTSYGFAMLYKHDFSHFVESERLEEIEGIMSSFGTDFHLKTQADTEEEVLCDFNLGTVMERILCVTWRDGVVDSVRVKGNMPLSLSKVEMEKPLDNLLWLGRIKPHDSSSEYVPSDPSHYIDVMSSLWEWERLEQLVALHVYHSGKRGIEVTQIADALVSYGYRRIDILMEVLDLHEAGRIQEISEGIYVPEKQRWERYHPWADWDLIWKGVSL